MDAKKERKKPAFLTILLLIFFTIILFALIAGIIWHAIGKRVTEFEIVIDGEFASSENEENGQNETEQNIVSISDNNSGNKYLSEDSFKFIDAEESQLSNGRLVLVDKNHPYVGDTSNFTTFEGNTNGCYYISSFSLSFQSEMLNQLKQMTRAYFDEYGKAEIYFQNTSNTDTSSSYYCNDVFAERASGYTVDILMRDGETGQLSYIDEFTNQWVLEHCTEYGFIVRYTEDKSSVTGVTGVNYHLRYVGLVSASIMEQEDMCLEEYLEYLNDFDYKNPLCHSIGDMDYELYYVSESEQIPVPKNEEQNKYYISGNNMDGYIVIVVV